MAHESMNEFTDWCYNRFVDEFQKSLRISPMVALMMHIEKNLKSSRFKDQRFYARMRLKDMEDFLKNPDVDSLRYRGEELEVQQILEGYRQSFLKQDDEQTNL
jgi:hypothetical protein